MKPKAGHLRGSRGVGSADQALTYTGGARQGQTGEAKRGAAPGRGRTGAPAPGRGATSVAGKMLAAHEDLTESSSFLNVDLQFFKQGA